MRAFGPCYRYTLLRVGRGGAVSLVMLSMALTYIFIMARQATREKKLQWKAEKIAQQEKERQIRDREVSIKT